MGDIFADRKKLAGLIAVVVAVAVIVVVLLSNGSSSKAATTTVKKVDKTATTVSPPIVAKPPPAVKPAQVVATGACKDALDGIRAVIDRFPSGSLLDAAANAELTVALANGNKSCSAAVYLDFNNTELKPWLTYSVPK